MKLYKTAQYGFLFVLIAWVMAGAFLALSKPDNSLLDHPVVGAVFFLVFVACTLGWGLVSLVHNRIYATEFKVHFDRTAMEKPLRWLLQLLGIVVTDDLPLCTAALFSSLAVIIAIGMTAALTVSLCFPELFVH